MEAGEEIPPKVLIELLSYKHERRQSQIQKLNNMPVYPTEEVRVCVCVCAHIICCLWFFACDEGSGIVLQILWDENIVPNDYYYGDGCLALPKLNLQFLTLHDYLLRNFILFRLESTCEWAGVGIRGYDLNRRECMCLCTYIRMCECERMLVVGCGQG